MSFGQSHACGVHPSSRSAMQASPVCTQSRQTMSPSDRVDSAVLRMRLLIERHQALDRRLGLAGGPQLVQFRALHRGNAALEAETVDDLRNGCLKLVDAVLEALDSVVGGHGLFPL